MVKVSVIIPFYNVEEYLEQCLNSVISQTLQDIEIILINDCSTDKSLQMAQMYAEKDNRIKIIDLKKRSGQGYARNRGIEEAQGEYIGFVDSDDFIDSNMYELLYNTAKSGCTDITMCQAVEYDDINNQSKASDYYSLKILDNYPNGFVFSAEDTKHEIEYVNVAVWNKIYNREYILKIEERFPEGFIYEDLPFFIGTYLNAKKINIVWSILYYYRINRKYSTMTWGNNHVLDRTDMVSLYLEKLKSFPFYGEIRKEAQAFVINDLFHRFIQIKNNYSKEFFFLMKKVYENLEIDDINDVYWQKVYHFPGYLLVINNNYEEFNQIAFKEYLDIRSVENRLRIEFSTDDIRFEKIYSDIKKVYKYIDDNNNEIHGTIDYIFSDMNKIYKYVESLSNNLKEDYTNQVNEKSSSAFGMINENKSKIDEIINKTDKITNYLKNQKNKIKTIQEKEKEHIERINNLKKDLLSY